MYAARCGLNSIIGVCIAVAVGFDIDPDCDSDSDSECACLLIEYKILTLKTIKAIRNFDIFVH
jgi:hypothetical protein